MTRWNNVRLGDVCDATVQSVDPRRDPARRFTYIDISSVDNKSKSIRGCATLNGVAAPSRARQIVRRGDILVSTTRPNLNAVAIVPGELDGAIASTGFCVLRPRPSHACPDFIFAFVRSSDFVRAVSGLVNGAMYPAVTDGQVRNVVIPLPPIPEQRRIAAILDEQIAAVERARTAAGQQLGAARALPAAYLRSVFESDEARTWRMARLGEVLALRKDVVHPYDNPSGRATFVGLEHVESVIGTRLGALEVEMSLLTGRKPRFFQDDIVYGYLRPYLNKVWVADFDGLCSVDQYVYAVRTGRALPHFVAWFMRSPTFLARAPIATTPGQLPRIRTGEVVSVEIGLPNIPEQGRVVSRIVEAIGLVNGVRRDVEEQLTALDGLTAGVLRRAFRGEL